MRRILVTFLVVNLWACNPAQDCRNAGLCVDCQAACQRMVECHVSFNGEGAAPGGGDEQARCERGCVTTDTMTPARERCITGVDPSDTARCQKQVLGCLGADAGNVYGN